jgi:PAS domain S-box-containing protein
VLRIVLVYVVVGCAWIFLSDRIPLPDDGSQVLFQTVKGIGYVLVTAGLLYALTWRMFARQEAGKREIERSERRMRRLVENLPYGAAYVEDGGRRLFVNRAVEALTGRQAQELPDLDAWFRALFPEDPEAERARHEAERAAGFPEARTFWVTRKDGERRLVERAAFQDARREVWMLADVTARHQAEQERERLREELQQAARLEAIGRLAGGVAHDFNNLLTGIIGHVTLGMAEAPPDGPLRETLTEVRRAAESAAAVTRQLLVFSRRQLVAPRRLDVRRTIEQLERMLRRLIGEDVALRVLPGEALWDVRIDPSQLEQALVNLAVNARDAMPQGGQLTFAARNVTLTDADLPEPGLAPGEYVAIAVTDSGSGMTEEVRRRVFEPFFTTKGLGRGTGLGLATTYGAARQAGGTVVAASRPGAGSTFTIFLPRAVGPDPEEPARTPATEVRARGGDETILVVEDEDAVARLVERVLTRAGYRVLAARDGAAALALADAPPRGRIDLLLADVVLPGMDGGQLAERLKATHPETRVLFTSGYTDDVIVQRGVLKPGIAFLAKPYAPADLVAKVRSVLDEPAAAAATPTAPAPEPPAPEPPAPEPPAPEPPAPEPPAPEPPAPEPPAPEPPAPEPEVP